MEQITSEIKEIVAEAIDLELDEFTNEEHLYNELGADSVVGFEILTKIQKKYKITIDPKEAPALMSVDKLAETVQSKTAQN
jgi:acyl carrier protein